MTENFVTVKKTAPSEDEEAFEDDEASDNEEIVGDPLD